MSRFGRSRQILTTAALVGVLALAGCSGTADKTDRDAVEQSGVPQSAQSAEVAQPDPAATDAKPAAEAGSLATVAQAVQTAEALVDDSTAVKIEQEHRGDRLEVKLYTTGGDAYEVLLGADGKEVIEGPRQKHSDDHDRGKHTERLATMAVTLQEAADLLENEFPGANILEMELDSEHGMLVWEVEFLDGTGKKADAEFDAVSGDLLRVDTHR